MAERFGPLNVDVQDPRLQFVRLPEGEPRIKVRMRLYFLFPTELIGVGRFVACHGAKRSTSEPVEERKHFILGTT